MSNIAEFDVPEQPENNSQQEIKKENKNENTGKPKNSNSAKKKPATVKPSLIFNILGLTAIIAAAANVYTIFNNEFTYPLQDELTPYTLAFLVVSYACFKIAKTSSLTKIGIFVVYMTALAIVVNKIYIFVTTGQFSW